MNLKGYIAMLLGAGVPEIETRRIESRKPVGIRLDYTPSKVKKGPFKGWPGNAKRHGRVKYRAKKHIKKMAAIKARKENRARFKVKMFKLLERYGKFGLKKGKK
jgi:hypothetical protein